MAETTQVTRAFWDAGTPAPIRPIARQALLAALDDGWADPSRLHREGRAARLLLDGARQAIAAGLGVRTEELALTGSFPLAVHAGVLGALAGRARVGRLLTHSRIEHSAVLACARWHGDHGGTTAAVEVDRYGRLDADAYPLADETGPAALAVVQVGNGEVGTLQPVEQLAARCRTAGVPLLVDAALAAGAMALPEADLLVADPAGWGAPGGIGVLTTRAGVRWRSPWPQDGEGGAHVPGAPGGAAIPQALAAAVALEAALADTAAADTRRRSAIDRLRRALPSVLRDIEVVGHASQRLPHVLTFSVLFADGEALVEELDRAGFAVGSGSACTSAALEPSHVLAAMGVLTHGNVRIALPATTPTELLDAQIDQFLDVLPPVVERVRNRLGGAGL